MEERLVECESNIRVLFQCIDQQLKKSNLLIHARAALDTFTEKIEELKKAEEELSASLSVNTDKEDEYDVELMEIDDLLKSLDLPELILKLTVSRKNDIMKLIADLNIKEDQDNLEKLRARISKINRKIDFLESFLADDE